MLCHNNVTTDFVKDRNDHDELSEINVTIMENKGGVQLRYTTFVPILLFYCFKLVFRFSAKINSAPLL